MYEYKEEAPAYGESLAVLCNKRAKEGWEVVSVIPHTHSHEVTDPYSAARGQMATSSSVSVLFRKETTPNHVATCANDACDHTPVMYSGQKQALWLRRLIGEGFVRFFQLLKENTK